jgi:hypothetical protein
MVSADTLSDRPPARAAWRAAFWPDACLEHLTEDDLVDLPRLQIGPRQQGPDHTRAPN